MKNLIWLAGLAALAYVLIKGQGPGQDFKGNPSNITGGKSTVPEQSTNTSMGLGYSHLPPVSGTTKSGLNFVSRY